MQPLSYQLAETSCWVACMLNGIRCLLKKEGENRVETPVYRIVHSLLQDRGVVYYEEWDLEALKEVYWRLEKYTGLAFEHQQGGKVKSTLRSLELNGDQRRDSRCRRWESFNIVDRKKRQLAEGLRSVLVSPTDAGRKDRPDRGRMAYQY